MKPARPPLVDVTALHIRGVHPAMIRRYIQAAETAWDQSVRQLKEAGAAPGSRPPISLHLKNPATDERTVMATVGVEGRFGVVDATTPDGLKTALARHLADRLA